MEHLKPFIRDIKSQLLLMGINDVLTHIDNDCCLFVFFFEDFSVFQKIHDKIHLDYSVDFFHQENMACIKIYTAAIEDHLLEEYRFYQIMSN